MRMHSAFTNTTRSRFLFRSSKKYGESSLPDQAKNGLHKSTVGGGLPRTLAHIWKSRCPPTDILCQGLGLVCGIPFAGMAPCREHWYIR